MRSKRLPNRELTEDIDEYVDAWESLGKRIEKALGPGWMVVSCNPGFTVECLERLERHERGHWIGPVHSTKDGQAYMLSDRIQISVDFALMLIDRLRPIS